MYVSICFKATELKATDDVSDVILVLSEKMTQGNEEVKEKARSFTMSIIIALLFFFDACVGLWHYNASNRLREKNAL